MYQFDDIKTHGGWADVPSNYSFLDFGGFLVFEPSATELDNLISPEDVNCATSSPNALYGTRYNFEPDRTNEPKQAPYFALSSSSHCSQQLRSSFALRALKLKPLNMPFAYTTLSIRGHGRNATLDWSVDFPAGFHDMLSIEVEKFSRQIWTNLTKVEVWADFHNDDFVIDWEFCLDDLEIVLEGS